MGQRTVTVCDGCRKEIEYLAPLRLSNWGQGVRDYTRLSEDHYFCRLGCLSVWLTKACESSRVLEKSADSIGRVRGSFIDDKLGLIC